jgi:putative ABC transport system ATP-binding protein
VVIRLRDIRKHYRVGTEQIRACDGVDLDVDRNEYVAIMGTSGSGKSTLMNILGCLDRPTSGTYELDGRLTTRMSAAQLATVWNERIGFVFQSFELMPRLTALRNVELPLLYAGLSRTERRRRASAALDAVGLADRLTHIPGRLSGGEQQRVAVARALVKEPRLLLADEPTGNLDSASGDVVLALLDDLNRRGVTVLLITHDPHVARHGRRRLAIHNGVVTEEGPADVIPR